MDENLAQNTTTPSTVSPSTPTGSAPTAVETPKNKPGAMGLLRGLLSKLGLKA